MRKYLTISVAALAVAASALPGEAAPRKPITMNYTTNTPQPFPDVVGYGSGACPGPVTPTNRDVRTLRADAPGKLLVKMTGFVGDYDIAIFDGDSGARIADGNNEVGTPGTLSPDAVETARVPISRPRTLQIHVCNFSGGPSATVDVTYTFRR